MCLGSVWNTRFPFELSASSIAVTMFFISTARAEANCSALIALGAWEVTTGVEEVLGAKPGISLFLFLFRLLFCHSALFPAFEEAILISEATSNQISGFSLSNYAQVSPNVNPTCAAVSFSCGFLCSECWHSNLVFFSPSFLFTASSCCLVLGAMRCRLLAKLQLSIQRRWVVFIDVKCDSTRSIVAPLPWHAKLMPSCREAHENPSWAHYKVLWTFLRFCSICLPACYLQAYIILALIVVK